MTDPKAFRLPESVAVVGMAGRFPHARNLTEFWKRLQGGEELVTFFSEDELLAEGLDLNLIRRPDYVPARAILDDAQQFDASFFGYTPREAESMDPQQRIFLECAWEALENAGYDPDRYPGDIGVFGGLSLNSYLYWNLLSNPDVFDSLGSYQIMLNNDKDFLTTRVSYKLGLRGPSVTVQTACSTSLVAVIMACQNLLGYHCDMALAGGVSISSPRKAGYIYQPGMILSPDGHCRAFDARAQGIVSGEGVGIVVLKRLSEALAAGDQILAVIKGAAINNDGSLKVGYTAPSVTGQAEAIAAAHAQAGVDAGSITYIEAHGTGTELGDPIEIAALTEAFRLTTDQTGFCSIGSVKTNLGHLDAAAGVAGLIKTVLALQHRQIPPSLHYEQPNPRIDFDSTPFSVNAALAEWVSPAGPRRAGVSSFGIGGTNAHLVLEEAPAAPEAAPARASQILLLSARSEKALQAAAVNLADHLRQQPAPFLPDAAYTLAVGRKQFTHRRVVITADREQAVSALESGVVLSGSAQSGSRPVAFMFTGQGSQHTGMGRDLFDSEPVFRQSLERCAQILRPHLGFDLLDVLYPTAEDQSEAEVRLLDTAVAQPALFAVEWALAQLWMAWGVRPAAMIGHSIGEYTAACLAGVFSLEDALRLVAARGRLMSGMPRGAMLSVAAGEQQVRLLLTGQLSLASLNTPGMCVVSGPQEEVAQFETKMAAQGLAVRQLHTSHAFHSGMMDPILDPFTKIVAAVVRNPPSIPFISNLTGDWITAEQAVSPAYWTAHLRSAVRFSQGVALLAQDPSQVLLELGPGGVLVALARGNPAISSRQPVFASLRHPRESTSDLSFILNTLGRMWLAGVEIDWQAFYAHENRQRIPLPSYPFEHQSYWIDAHAAQPGPNGSEIRIKDAPSGSGSLQKLPDIANWFYVPSWRRAAAPAHRQSAAPENWLVFRDPGGAADDFIRRLEQAGHTVTKLSPGPQFSQQPGGDFSLNPAQREDYDALLSRLAAAGNMPQHVVHFWCLPPTERGISPFARLAEAENLGFFCLLYLVQALENRGLTAGIDIAIVSSGVVDVSGDELIEPGRSLLIGPLRVISQEHPGLRVRLIDSPVGENGLLSAGQNERLSDELFNGLNEGITALRGRYRWVEDIEPLPLAEQAGSSQSLRPNGVYLITGGLGGVGFSLAAYIARTPGARLALLGRTALPDRQAWGAWLQEKGEQDPVSRRIQRVQALEALGAQTLVLQADVTDPDGLQVAVNRVVKHFGVIHGAIHAAGLPGGGVIALKDRQAAEQIMAPKTRGTIALGQALVGQPLDFLILCSSYNSLFGRPGQIDYSAANAFLDGFAQASNQSGGCRTISINWGAWAEVGMAAETHTPAHLQTEREAVLKQAILPAEGQAAFSRLLAHPLPQIVVSSQDVRVLLSLAAQHVPAADMLDSSKSADPEAQKPVSSTNGKPEAPRSGRRYNRPELAAPFVPPETPTQIKIAAIWTALLGVEPVGIHDNFFELGGHSLLATQLIARVNQAFQVDLSLRIIFEETTVGGLAERLDTILWAKDNQRANAQPVDEEREELEF